MPTYQTPHPIDIAVELGAGSVRVIASDRADTNVTVLPGGRGKASDVKAVVDTDIRFADGVLSVRRPKNWRYYSPLGSTGSVEVVLEVPTGSSLRGSTGYGALVTQGTLGAVSFSTSAGDLMVDGAGDTTLSSAAGTVSVARVDGSANLRTATGSVRLGSVHGTAEIKSSNGAATIGEVVGELHVKGANGSVSVDRINGTAEIKNAYGDVVIERAEAGSIRIVNGYGAIDFGVPEGVAAWLDLSSDHGTVRNLLEDAAPPTAADGSVELHAGTGWGAITVRRSRG